MTIMNHSSLGESGLSETKADIGNTWEHYLLLFFTNALHEKRQTN